MLVQSTGKVIEYKDGIILADGLSEAGYSELVKIHTNSIIVKGIVLNLEETRVGIIVLDNNQDIKQGDLIEATGELLSIKVSEGVLGRVLNGIGNPIDGKGDLVENEDAKEMLLDKIAPGVIERKDVERPMQTGILSIDAMIPIGRGQRQLIIGDRQTGKTTVAVDAIINQKKYAEMNNQKVIKCIYVAIGQKVSKIAQLTAVLEEAGAMEYTTIISAGASDPASMQYIAPYVGTAIAEYFAEKGDDSLIIYDDLTKHAFAYREISLLLRRPPGREAYPGDIFYLHSALLERGVQYSDANGGGSLTALPIIETQAGDVAAYIPTNVISITDGQIYLETDLFNAGIKPAINVGISVSRVGGSAQIKGMKQVAGQLRMDLAQHRELAAFAQFGSDLDEETKSKLNRGGKMNEILKQNQFHPLNTSEQVLLIYTGTKGYLDTIEVKEIAVWKANFLKYINKHEGGIFAKIVKGEKIEGELEDNIKKLIEDYMNSL